jgi:hypothetical protein
VHINENLIYRAVGAFVSVYLGLTICYRYLTVKCVGIGLREIAEIVEIVLLHFMCMRIHSCINFSKNKLLLFVLHSYSVGDWVYRWGFYFSNVMDELLQQL